MVDEDHLKICVAVLTYNRPERLERLLNAMSQLRMPEAKEVRFVVVDNDPDCSGRAVVEAANHELPGIDIHYVVENEPGIPAGRNRALDEALSSGSDLLCFTDDDAWPHPTWLLHLVECYRKSGATLVFGPQRLRRPPKLNSRWKRLIARSLEARSRFVERYSEREARKGRIATSGTYNWLGDLHWIGSRGLRFDTAMRFSGGEDSAFREAVTAKGGVLAWCPDAVIYEEVPEGRLTITYQFHRAKVQGMNAAGFERPVYPRILRHPVGRIMVGVGLMVLPVLGFASFSLGLHQLGMGIGVLKAHRGVRGHLYPR